MLFYALLFHVLGKWFCIDYILYFYGIGQLYFKLGIASQIVISLDCSLCKALVNMSNGGRTGDPLCPGLPEELCVQPHSNMASNTTQFLLS